MGAARIALWFAILGIACDGAAGAPVGDAAPAPRRSIPVSVTWSDGAFALGELRAEVAVVEDRLELHLSALPPGAIVETGREVDHFLGGGDAIILLDLPASLIVTPVSDPVAAVTVPVGVPLLVDLPDGRWIRTELPALSLSPAALLGEALRRRVRFAGEPLDTPARGLLWWRRDPRFGVRVPELVGKPRTLGEVTWVVDVEEVAGETIACDGYRSFGATPGEPVLEDQQIDVVPLDATYTVLDRRTREVVASRRFAASRDCPSTGTEVGGSLQQHVEPGAVAAWLKKLLRSGTRVALTRPWRREGLCSWWPLRSSRVAAAATTTRRSRSRAS